MNKTKYILLLVLLAIIAGGIFAWQKGYLNNIQEQRIQDKNETADWKNYRNDGMGYSIKEGRGFELKYPSYFDKDFIEGSTREYFQVSGERPDWLRVEVHLRTGFEYVDQPGAFSFRYNATSQTWESTNEGVPQDFAPKKRVTKSGLVYYYVETGDAAMSINKAFIPHPKEDIIVEIVVSRNESYRDCIEPCPESKPFSDEVMLHKILSTFQFLD